MSPDGFRCALIVRQVFGTTGLHRSKLRDSTSGAYPMTTFSLFATTPKHMESLMVEELRALGAKEVRETRAGASFAGSLALAYRICLWSRIANRVLLVLARFPAATPEALYAGVRTIPWHEHLEVGNTFAVALNSSQSQITHSHFGAQKVKDAIADQFRQYRGERPSVQTARPDLQFNVYLLRDEATLSLDLSGESLHRRGYRQEGLAAPLKENLASAILTRTGWPEIAKEGGALVDLMCGSGTLPIEAACMAADIAPGLERRHWGFSHWRHHDAAAWKSLLEEARARRAQGLAQLPSIRGYDSDRSAVRSALANVERAGLVGRVHIERADLADPTPPRGGKPGLVVANPPYGERLGAESELPALYSRLGERLKADFQGWRAAVFTGNPELGKNLGLRARRMHSLYNGRIECRLLHFEITPRWFVAPRPHPRPLPAQERGEGAQMLVNRLQKNRKHLGRWLKRGDIRCYRLYDADLPEYAIAVDVYEDGGRRLHVQEYEAPKSVDPGLARRRLREALGVLLEVADVPEDRLFFKVRRRQKGRAQYQKLAATDNFFEIREGDCRFLVNLEDYLDTGLFLDHRLTRRMLGRLARGRRFLNLFAYTGTATVYAAKGGAVSTTSVDLSNTYLDWAKRNMALNGLTGAQHEFVRADCLEWLEKAAARVRYGLIFLDPPSFSTSKRMQGTFDVQRDHAALIRQTAALLEPDGILIFSNNRRRFRLDRRALAGLAVDDISRQTLDRDFERSPGGHNCWKISRPVSAGAKRS